MTRMISAIYENGAFRPTEPVGDLPEHTPVRLTLDVSVADPWVAYRARLSAAGLPVPAPGAWKFRQGELLNIEGPPVSQTLIEDRR